MRYIVTGAVGKLAGRVADNMLAEAPAQEMEMGRAGVAVRETNYTDKVGMMKAFNGGDRVYFISSIINGPKRVTQHQEKVTHWRDIK